MAFSLNKVQLIGHLGKDSETRVIATGTSVTSFTVATNHSYKGKEGNWIDETTWHNVVAWSLSDYMQGVLKKGAKVYVEGRLSKRDYTDKEGMKRYVTEVVSEKLIPLDPRVSDQGRDFTAPTTSQDIEPQPKEDDLPF
ncbi:MAG: single-stranded DNA-binding protein [Ignavibacteriaceae bacterium]